MILTGSAIARAVAGGELAIEPYDPRHLNPNSYNVHLASTIFEFPHGGAGPPIERQIGPDGFTLAPHRLYLGSTIEKFGSARHVTCLISRSSVARLGLFVQLNADMGNIGAIHSWTLELLAVQPIYVYPDMRVAQIMFWRTLGQLTYYTGEYSHHNDPTPCRYVPSEMIPDLESQTPQ